MEKSYGGQAANQREFTRMTVFYSCLFASIRGCFLFVVMAQPRSFAPGYFGLRILNSVLWLGKICILLPFFPFACRLLCEDDDRRE